jgi:hypothetical protein
VRQLLASRFHNRFQRDLSVAPRSAQSRLHVMGRTERCANPVVIADVLNLAQVGGIPTMCI